MCTTNFTKYGCATVGTGVMEYNDIFTSNSWLTNTTDNTSQYNATMHYHLESTVSPELMHFKCSMSSTFKHVIMAAMFCTLVVSFFGNSLIMVSLRRFRTQFKGSLYMFIGNLAVSDIFLATGLTLHILEVLCPSLNLSGNMWYCIVKLSITVTSYTESGITLML